MRTSPVQYVTFEAWISSPELKALCDKFKRNEITIGELLLATWNAKFVFAASEKP